MPTRKLFFVLSLVVAAALGRASAADAQQVGGKFDFDSVSALAEKRAAKPYGERAPALPKGLAKLTYDQYRGIRFRPESALWRDQARFEVQFFHLGFNFKRPVNMFEVSDAGVRPISYRSEQFNFGKTRVPSPLPADLGFAGFRVHFPMHTPAYKDELIVFLGASYFRLLGRNQTFGISARGLAIDTATPEGEEFPSFTDFWLVRPSAEQRSLTIYALLDSKSITGAYRFDIRPGEISQVEVRSRLYPRMKINKLGVAPLTSMFLYGENARTRAMEDLRPEVHDSDGMMAQTGAGEWLWRPLHNPRDLRVSRFLDENPRAFGLIQRDRDFSNYQDLEANYHARPSYWVEPLAAWGKGAVELVEIPSDEEIHDNMVAYWVPEAPVEAGKPLEFSYLLSAFSRTPAWPPGGRAVATRLGSARVPGVVEKPVKGMRRMTIDFTGGDLDGLAGAQPVKAQLTANGAEIDDLTVQRVPDSGLWRVSFRIKSKGDLPIELRCYLALYGEALTETWAYQITP